MLVKLAEEMMTLVKLAEKRMVKTYLAEYRRTPRKARRAAMPASTLSPALFITFPTRIRFFMMKG